MWLFLRRDKDGMLSIALLVLLPALVLSDPYRINWEKCGIDNVCFCPDDVDKPFEIAIQKDVTDVKAINTKCSKGGMQNKFFTEETALFQLQVIGGPNAVGNDPPSLILQEEGIDKYIGCKYEDGTPKLDVKPEEWIQKYTITLFEDRSRFEPEYVLCSIKVERTTELYKQLKSNENTIMRLITSEEKKFSTPSADIYDKDDDAIKCDPFAFNDVEYDPNFHVLPIINRDKLDLTCENYGESYTMRSKKSEKKEVNIEKLACENKDGSEYLYTLVTGTDDAGKPVGPRMFAPELFTVYCAAQMEEVCQDPNGGKCDWTKDKTCPKFTPGGKDANGVSRPAKFTCPGNKWVIETCETCPTYHELEADPVCKRDDYKDNSAAFHAKILGAEEQIGNGARCFTKYEGCKEKSNLVLPAATQCDESKKESCDAVDESDKMKLKCQIKEREMTVELRGSNGTAVKVAELLCNLDNGLWYIPGEQKTIVTATSVVRCVDPVDRDYSDDPEAEI